MQKIHVNDDNDLKYLSEEEKEKKKKREAIITEENSDVHAELEYITE